MNLWGAVDPKWLYVFMAWDTSWYVTMAQTLSFSLDRTFFPGYPLLIRVVGDITGNFYLSAFLIAITLGFASLPLFQAIAEAYMSRSEALGSTIVMSFFPYVFLFTTVPYAESLFLFVVLAAWYSYLRNRIAVSTLFSIFATLTKSYGVLIMLPMLLDLLRRRKWRDFLITSTPMILIAGIILPLIHKNIVNRLILELNAATWSVSRETLGNYWFRDFIVPIFTSESPMKFFHFFHAYALAFIVVIGYFAITSTKIDWRLGLYSTLMFLTIIVFGYTNGVIRYTSFIFPIWLNTRVKNPAIIIPVMILFYIHSLVLWHQFLWASYPF